MKKLRPNVKRLRLRRSRKRMAAPFIVSGTGDERRSSDGTRVLKHARRAGRLRRLGAIRMGAVLLACLAVQACCSNLRASYVRSMEATRVAVEADVEAGLYKPDGTSRRTLDGWAKANQDAKAVLEAEGKWGQ